MKTQEHEACSYCYTVVRCDGQTGAPVVYRGSNAAENFLALQKEKRKIKAVLANPQAMPMTREDWRAYNSATSCRICVKPLEGDSVRDHCHISGRYRGAAHKACNLKLRLNPKTTPIPVVFHNLRGYDLPADASHFKGGRQGLLHPQQHRKVHLILSRCSSASSVVCSSCLPLSTSWLRPTSLRLSRSQRNTSRTRLDAN